MKLNKKGSEALPTATLVEFILIALIVSLMVLVIAREMSSTKFEKQFLAKDTAMFIDTLYASPNDIIVRYPQKTYGFSFEFQNSRVIVYSEKESKTLGEGYYYTEGEGTELIEKDLVFNRENLEISDTEDVPVIFIKTNYQIEPFRGIFVGDGE